MRPWSSHVRVSQHGKKAHCRASFRMRPAAVVVAAPAPSAAAPPPATGTSTRFGAVPPGETEMRP